VTGIFGVRKESAHWIKVLHEIVGHAVTLHLTSLGDEVGRELPIADPEDRIYV
jgi:hypothetical protein